MSGSQAHYGKDNENGVRMAIEDLNKEGLMIGGKKIKFEIQAEDDAADPKQGTAVAQKLCDSKVAGVVGHLNSGTTIPASKVYSDCGIPQITGAATNPDLTKPGYKTTFRIIANDNALGAGLALYAADTLKLKKVAIIDDRTAYGQGVAEVFKKTAQAKGMQVVDQQFTTDKATDFMAILTAIKAKSPDAIFYGGMDAAGRPHAAPDGAARHVQGQVLRRRRHLHHRDHQDGCRRQDAWTAWFAPKVARRWRKCLAARPGRRVTTTSTLDQFQIYSPYTYDATMVLVDAMKRANSTDPEVYLPQVCKTDYKGVTSTDSGSSPTAS